MFRPKKPGPKPFVHLPPSFSMDDFDCLVQSLELQNLPVKSQETAAGRGLFAATHIPPSTPLFTIPACNLVNCRTLRGHYPAGLTAIQLISLHLCLHRFSTTSTATYPFGSYICTLPREFDTHPLTSRVQQRDLNYPPSIAIALDHLHARYLDDLRLVRRYLHFHSDSLSQKLEPDSILDAFETDFLWGWLNVNTRCIYHRLKATRADPDNITLCPILDFANHSIQGSCMTPRLSNAERANASPIPKLGDPLTLMSPPTLTKAGEELYLTYGAHSNRTLYVEYGFVIPCSLDDPRAEVDVQDIVESIFNEQGLDGTVKKKMLQDSGYYGEWILDGSPAVSYRLITALRLLHVLLDDADGSLSRWQETLTGVRDMISDANERAWQETVCKICSCLIERGEGRNKEQNSGAIGILWEEELSVSARILCQYRVPLV
ncbi:hypothetical protein R3P38DRAFT_2998161, partial [Favolaschia claudopus]